MPILIALLVFSAVILVHELGHFLVARWVGIKVDEFSMGFGPRLTGFQGKATKYSIRLIPMGGYVKMLGEDPEEEQSAVSEDNYQNKTPLQRMAVIAAGPAMNFVLAVLLFIIIFGAIGVHALNVPQVGSVMPDSPASEAGLEDGDEIKAIDSQPMESWEDVQQYIRNSQGGPLRFTIIRQESELALDITPRAGENNPEVGISPPIQRLSIGASIVEGFKETYALTKAVLQSLVGIITRQIPTEDLTGPIGIVHFVGEAARSGMVNVLYLTALISVNLGLFNLLPIPALDGSKLVFLGFELVGKPVDPHKESIITLVGFVLLISLMLVVMYRDIVRFIL